MFEELYREEIKNIVSKKVYNNSIDLNLNYDLCIENVDDNIITFGIYTYINLNNSKVYLFKSYLKIDEYDIKNFDKIIESVNVILKDDISKKLSEQNFNKSNLIHRLISVDIV